MRQTCLGIPRSMIPASGDEQMSGHVDYFHEPVDDSCPTEELSAFDHPTVGLGDECFSRIRPVAQWRANGLSRGDGD